MTFAPVFAVWDYFDRPRSGVALVREQPCYFECNWNEEADDYADTYEVYPLDGDTLSLVLEQWDIFHRWHRAFHAGEVALATHPSYPGQNERYSEIDGILKRRVKSNSSIGQFMVEFSAKPGQESLPPGIWRELEAEWRPVV